MTLENKNPEQITAQDKVAIKERIEKIVRSLKVVKVGLAQAGKAEIKFGRLRCPNCRGKKDLPKVEELVPGKRVVLFKWLEKGGLVATCETPNCADFEVSAAEVARIKVFPDSASPPVSAKVVDVPTEQA